MSLPKIIENNAPIALLLIPTPLADEAPIYPDALQYLTRAAQDESILILVEEHKVARRKWLASGLPRESISRMIEFNEHTEAELAPKILEELKAGKRAVLLSDGGMPAFYDPGQKLVDLCQINQLRVSCAQFPNSMILALSLSGFPHKQFYFAGFLPQDTALRKESLERLARHQSETIVMMDTPYRLHSLVNDLAASPLGKRQVFVGMDLNRKEERTYRGSVSGFLKLIEPKIRTEFVLVVKGDTGA